MDVCAEFAGQQDCQTRCVRRVARLASPIAAFLRSPRCFSSLLTRHTELLPTRSSLAEVRAVSYTLYCMHLTKQLALVLTLRDLRSLPGCIFYCVRPSALIHAFALPAATNYNCRPFRRALKAVAPTTKFAFSSSTPRAKTRVFTDDVRTRQLALARHITWVYELACRRGTPFPRLHTAFCCGGGVWPTRRRRFRAPGSRQSRHTERPSK